MRIQPTAQVVSLVGSLVEERIGLHFGPGDLDILAERATTRALQAGFDSMLDYYYFLRYDAASARELDALVDALVVGETYLFRELPQLEALIDHVLAPAVAAGRRPRVWSAACATGEEPVSLAVLLAREGLLSDVDIVASDVSRRALERAQACQLGRRAVRGALPPGVTPWLSVRDGDVTVAPAVREAIEWRRVNLVDRNEVAALGCFDAILCRNVLIYFSDATARSVVTGLTNALGPGGVLLVGISESLLRYDIELACEERGGVFMYRKEASR